MNLKSKLIRVPVADLRIAETVLNDELKKIKGEFVNATPLNDDRSVLMVMYIPEEESTDDTTGSDTTNEGEGEDNTSSDNTVTEEDDVTDTTTTGDASGEGFEEEEGTL